MKRVEERTMIQTLVLLLTFIVSVRSTCRDTSGYCRQWALQKKCTTGSYVQYMRQNCKVSCNLCGTRNPSRCIDLNTNCKSWQQQGECSKNPAYMLTSCKLSCGVCGGGVQWGNWGGWSRCSKKCGKGIKQRTRTCRGGNNCQGNRLEQQYCNTKRCQNTEPGVRCADIESFCSYWKTVGKCSTMRDFMSRYCKYTCGWCGGTVGNAKWSSWGAWSGCSRSCEKRTKKRTRTCKGGSNCPGPSLERQNCNTKQCPITNCGRINLQLSARIIGGQDSQEGKWPWQVGIFNSDYSKKRGRNVPVCGGTLIRSNVVLTAAHCFDLPLKAPYTVRVGDFDLTETGKYEKTMSVAKTFKHERYDKSTYQNDIAVMLLEKNVKLSREVNIACLPGEKDDLFTMCDITGWGLLKTGRRPKKLQEAKVPLVPQNACIAAYRDTKHKIRHGMICAGYEKGGIDACQGDSGGPLVCEWGRKYFLTGVTSFGYGCGQEGFYGVYTDTRKYLQWINDKIKS